MISESRRYNIFLQCDSLGHNYSLKNCADFYGVDKEETWDKVLKSGWRVTLQYAYCPDCAKKCNR